MRGTIPKNGIIEFLGYVKNKINGKNLIIFQRPPKLICAPNYQIGDPLEYEKRMENEDYIRKCEEFKHIDITIPIKKANVQPMDEYDSDFEGMDAKMNQKDKRILNNPEEGGNPFSMKSKKGIPGKKPNRDEGISQSDDSDNDGEPGQSHS